MEPVLFLAGALEEQRSLSRFELLRAGSTIFFLRGKSMPQRAREALDAFEACMSCPQIPDAMRKDVSTFVRWACDSQRTARLNTGAMVRSNKLFEERFLHATER